jgi:anaerobic magnesium-protoporphyrin IX monomethyl ester cyclase
MFKTILCIPPDYDHNYPPLGTPALSAFLKKNGFACSQVDLNLGYRDFLASHVSGPIPVGREERLFFLKPLLEKFFSHNLKKKYYSDFLPGGDDGLFPRLPYGNNTNSSFYFCERLLSSEYLWQYLEDKDENTFYQFYRDWGIVSSLAEGHIDLLGISVISPTQAIAGLTLGLLVKKALPRIHVNIGGQWPTLYREAILRKRELFRCFDSVVVFEGEHALCELAKRLAGGRSIYSIPNVVTVDTVSGGAVTGKEEKMDLLPCPDFDGLVLKDYDGSKDGQISLTFETSRGCYWSKCAYCVDLPLPKPAYRAKSAELVVNDMKELKKRYNAQYLLFGDPGLSPRQMREISLKMTEESIEMEWWTMARLDPGFNREVFDRAHAAGLRQVNFGFESASDRICRLMDKGNQRERSSRIIRDCAQAGIKVDLQTMVGLPGESFEDGMETIDFLVSHKEFISSVTFNTYYLTPANYVYLDPAKYGIEYENRTELPFAFFIPFKNKNGMGTDWAYQLEKMYHSLVNKNIISAAEEIPGLPGHVSEGYVEFSLNGELCRLRYRHDAQTDLYTFIQDKDEGARNYVPAGNSA